MQWLGAMVWQTPHQMIIACNGSPECAGTGRAANPLAHVLQAIGEPLELLEYNSWNVVIPEGAL